MSADLTLSAPESATLVQCEAVIRQGLESFITVGTALCRIRDERLYRATHPNFQAYCEITWGFGREYAHRLIGAANVVGMLPIGNTITNEAQARELARVAPEQRAEVLERAGPNPTAKAIREAATPSAKSQIQPKTTMSLIACAVQAIQCARDVLENEPVSPEDADLILAALDETKKLAKDLLISPVAGSFADLMYILLLCDEARRMVEEKQDIASIRARQEGGQ